MVQKMIDYTLFQFSCPPRTGTAWFIQAAQLAGLGPGFKRNAHAPFPAERKREVLRVSLVRHPCEWLASCYAALQEGGPDVGHLGRFARLNGASFDDYVRSYLREVPGAVGRLYAEYRADSFLRLEDMPWALVELLEAAGVPKVFRGMVSRLPRQNPSASTPRWDPSLRRRVLDAERRTLEDFDYC